MTSKSFVTTALIIMGLTVGIGTVQADDTSTTFTQKVGFSDLNLDSDLGAKVFYARVTAAARQVCSPLERSDLALASKWHGCYDAAVSNAVASVDKSKVTALYQRNAKPAGIPALASLR